MPCLAKCSTRISVLPPLPTLVPRHTTARAPHGRCRVLHVLFCVVLCVVCGVWCVVWCRLCLLVALRSPLRTSSYEPMRTAQQHSACAADNSSSSYTTRQATWQEQEHRNRHAHTGTCKHKHMHTHRQTHTHTHHTRTRTRTPHDDFTRGCMRASGTETATTNHDNTTNQPSHDITHQQTDRCTGTYRSAVMSRTTRRTTKAHTATCTPATNRNQQQHGRKHT